MSSTVITHVEAHKDAVDRLDWRLRTSIERGERIRERVHLLRWSGTLKFYRPSRVGSGASGPHEAHLTLPATWVHLPQDTYTWTLNDISFVLSTRLFGDALDRIERFRQGGQLYVRVVGHFYMFVAAADRSQANLSQEVEDWHDPRVTTTYEVRSDDFEMSRDRWSTEVLTKLRPPGHRILELSLPSIEAEHEGGQRALRYLKEAQAAFDRGQYDVVASRAYRAIDGLHQAQERFEKHYGKFGARQINVQIKAFKSLCNTERHSEAEHHDGLKFDRVLAHHALIGAQDILGVLFAFSEGD